MLYSRSLWFIYFTHIIVCIWGFPCGSDGKESACSVGDQGLIPGWEDPVFPGSSVGKEPTCNAGDLGLIPGSEEPLEKGKATHSSILAWNSFAEITKEFMNVS